MTVKRNTTGLSGRFRSSWLASGPAAIVFACILWPSTYCIRKTYLAQISPFMLLFLTCIAIVLFAVVALPRFTLAALRTFKSAPWRCLGISFAGVVCGSTLFNFGLDRLDVGVAGVLEKLQPVFVIFLGALFLGERYPLNGIPWVIIALSSSYVVSQKNLGAVRIFEASFQGMVFALLAAFCYSVAAILGRSVLTQGASSAHIAFLRFFLAAPVFLVIIVCTGEIAILPQLPFDLFAYLAFAAVFLTGGGYLCYYRGLQLVPAANASLIELTSSIFAVFLGMIFLGEQLHAHQLIAGLLLLVSITMASRSRHKPSTQLQVLEKIE